VGTAGDVNGDGFDDVIVGAQLYTSGQSFEGAAFVYHGSPSGLSTTHNWMDESDQIGAFYGSSVGTAGDVNGDGYDDVIVGALHYQDGQTSEGAAAVYYGSSSGLSPVPNWLVESNQDNAQFGTSVGTAGDVNGDGFADVIVGAPFYTRGQEKEGAASVYYGSPDGLSLIPNWVGDSNQANANYGVSVGTAGDVNRDGFDDVIVGAHTYDNGHENEGAAAVYHGSATGLSLVPNWLGEGDQMSSGFGSSVSTAGDVNGDGYDDVIVGAPEYNVGPVDGGAAFVYHGSAGGLSLVSNWEDFGVADMLQYGYSVGSAGDVDGDGYDDVIVGACSYTAFAYYGSAGGLSLDANWAYESGLYHANYGHSVGTAGDVNGDGLDDAIVGAYRYDNGDTEEGAAYVYHGSGYYYSFLPLAIENRP
jgi:hypothetical protein